MNFHHSKGAQLPCFDTPRESAAPLQPGGRFVLRPVSAPSKFQLTHPTRGNWNLHSSGTLVVVVSLRIEKVFKNRCFKIPPKHNVSSLAPLVSLLCVVAQEGAGMEGALGPSETPVSLPVIFKFDAGFPCRMFMSVRMASGFFTRCQGSRATQAFANVA